MNGIHLEIRGRVQGVGFRWFIRETALRLDLAGWVSNRSDGNVELAAAGDAHAVERLEAAARKGPPGAMVEEVRSLPAIDAATLTRPFGIVRRERL
ncbi:MAG TPA: acylphosphatase [Gemmatimonadaceae bacterium]|nr:acylphosphatase [Gemmatimonadaceae bacterium]